MYVIVTATNPLNKSQEVGEIFKKYLESPLPAFVKLLHVFLKPDKDYGSLTYFIYEVENARFSDGYNTIARTMMPFWQIEGYKYSIDKVTDGLAWIQQQG